MSLILTIVRETTALSRQSTDEVGVIDAGLLEFLPQVSPPAIL
jgi:hypothetical protein